MQKWWNCDQYLLKFNFGHFSASWSSPFLLGKTRFSKKRCLGEIYNFLLPGVVMIRIWGRSLLRDMSKKWTASVFWLRNVFSSNLNSMNLKLFCNHGMIYSFGKKFKKYSGEMNPSGVHRNMRGCVREVNSEGIEW